MDCVILGLYLLLTYLRILILLRIHVDFNSLICYLNYGLDVVR